MDTPMPRREFVTKAALGALAVLTADLRAMSSTDALPGTAKKYLADALYTKKEVDDWLAGKAFPFAKYSSEFGWLLRNARFRDGMDDSISVYTYGPLDERITLNYRDQPCRINTYGNSFTQCHQVSDGETWQEGLAAHFQEPVRNFGIGGWSVYQAYLRMLREEARVPAEYLILNIYEDDHFRNLDAWRNLRAKKHVQFIEPPLPHVRVNVKERTFEERPNPTPTPESLYNLCDLDWVMQTFGDDFTLQILLAHANAKTKNPERSYADVLSLATTHGIVTRVDTAETLSQAADALHHQAAYFATERIVEKVEAFAAEKKKKVLYVLSYSPQFIARAVTEGIRPDQGFVDFLKTKNLPVVDLLTAHAEEFTHYKGTVTEYLKKYFVGHYNPRGNQFTALAIKDRLAAMMTPKPAPYRADAARW